MPRTLLAYSTVDGHTRRICDRMKHVLELAGHHVQLFDIDDACSFDLSPFDQVVVGASIRYGRHRSNVYRFVDANRDVLDRKASAFFSVNVVARKAGKDTPQSNPYVQAFLRKVAWAPGDLAVFAGKLDYPRYRFFDRQVIRFIMWLTNGPTDPSSCVEFTNWRSVETFARRLSNALELRPASAQSAVNANAASDA